MLRLYGTRRDTKIREKVISGVQRSAAGIKVFVAEGKEEGQKTKVSIDLSGRERIWERFDADRALTVLS